MTRFKTLAWSAAACTYLLIVLGAVVRITHSGLGCGDHWPLCNGRLFPPLDDIGTVIEWSHRLLASVVSILVAALAVYAWRLRVTTRAPYVALALLVIQVLLGAITVKTGLTATLVVLHLANSMALLYALLVSTTGSPQLPAPRSGVLVTIAFTTVLFGGLVANLGASAACGGFPLCNGQVWITAGPLAWLQWIHRLLAYSLAVLVTVWAVRSRSRAAFAVLGLIAVQISIGAATVLLGLPSGLQAAHVAVGAAVWASVVLATRRTAPETTEAPAAAPGPR